MDGAFPSQRGEPFGGQGRGSGGGGRGFRGTSENAKTKLCTRWMEGDCRFGDRCNFAHGEHELRKLPGGPDGAVVAGAAGGAYMGGGRGGGRGTYPYGGRGRGYGGPEEQYAQGYGRGYGGGPQGYGGGGYGGPGGMAPGGYGGAPGARPEENWAAAQGFPTPGPNGWFMYHVKETGEAYYHNQHTNQTTWDRPPEWPPHM